MSTTILGIRPAAGKPLHKSPRPRLVRNQAGCVVGSIRVLNGRTVLYSRVDERLHMLRSPRAWAKDRVALDEARRAGAEAVVLEDHHAARSWDAPLDAFDAHGLDLNRGHGEQVALPVERWHVEDLHGPQQLPLIALGAGP